MQKRFFLTSIWAFILFCSSLFAAPPFNFDSQSSTVRINAGGKLNVNNPIRIFDGTLIKDAGGLLQGNTITFFDGVLQDEGNNLLLSAVLNPSGTIFLTGDSSICAKPGDVLQQVQVTGVNNIIKGSPVFTDTVTLADNTTELTLAVGSGVTQNVTLNGGTVKLKNDLHFTDQNFLSGNGVVNGNGYKLFAGSKLFAINNNITWQDCSNLVLCSCVNVMGDLVFNGKTTINGNGNVLDLNGAGTITVGPGGTLTLSNMTVKGIDQDSFVFQDESSTLNLSDVDFELISDVELDQGNIFVKGSGTWFIKNYDWTFTDNSTITVDGVTLWLDRAGQEVIGEVVFDGPEADFFTSIASGTIKTFEDCCNDLQTQIDECCGKVDECCSTTFTLISMVDICCSELEECCSRIDECCIDNSIVEDCCSRVDVVESKVDECCIDNSIVEDCCSRVDVVESKVDECCIDNSIVEDCCSRVDVVESKVDECCIDNSIVEDCCSRVDVVESKVDECCIDNSIVEDCCSRVDVVESKVDECCIDNSIVEDCCSRVDVVESKVDECCIDNSIVEDCCSRVDVVESKVDECCIDNSIVEDCCSRVDVVESKVDECCIDNSIVEDCCSRVDVVESKVDECCIDNSIVEDCCSRVDVVESKVDECCIDNSIVEDCCSRVDVLESKVDECCIDNSIVEDCCSRVDVVESKVDECCIDNSIVEDCCSRVDVVESKVDECCNKPDCCKDLEKRLLLLRANVVLSRQEIEELKSKIDELAQEPSESREALECCRQLEQRVLFLRKEIKECCERTVTDSCCSLIDECFTRIDECCTRIDECCTRIDECCSQIDECCESRDACEILVTGTRYFKCEDLPAEGQAVIFRGDPCFGPCGDTPRLIFDPEVYGGQDCTQVPFNECCNDGVVPIQKRSRVIFSGELIVELRDGVRFLPLGTPYCFVNPTDRSDWPSIIIEDGAIMTVKNADTDNPDDAILPPPVAMVGGPRRSIDPDDHPILGSTIGAAVKFIIRQEGQLLLDRPSQFIFGGSFEDDFEVITTFNSAMTVRYEDSDDVSNNSGASQSALLTFQLACWDLCFDHQSAMNIYPGGIIEMNMYRGSAFGRSGNCIDRSNSSECDSPSRMPAEGAVRQWFFDEGSVLQVLRRGNEVGLLRMAPNVNFATFNPPLVQNGLGSDTNVNFNNRSGTVVGGGHIQFKEFVLAEPHTPIDAANDSRQLVYQQGGVLLAGTKVSSSVSIAQITLADRYELTANTFLPQGTSIARGSFIKVNGNDGVVTPVAGEVTTSPGVVFDQGTILAVGSVIASHTISDTLSNAVILAPRVGEFGAAGAVPGTHIPAGSTLAVGSELVNTTLRIQENRFEHVDSMVNTFQKLAFIIEIAPDQARATEDASILVRKGSLYPVEDGRITALYPPIRDTFNRDGTIVGLLKGDHDVKYGKSIGMSYMNEVVATNFNTGSETNVVITECDEGQRQSS